MCKFELKQLAHVWKCHIIGVNNKNKETQYSEQGGQLSIRKICHLITNENLVRGTIAIIPKKLWKQSLEKLK